jgi:hypothetical protein
VKPDYLNLPGHYTNRQVLELQNKYNADLEHYLETAHPIHEDDLGKAHYEIFAILNDISKSDEHYKYTEEIKTGKLVPSSVYNIDAEVEKVEQYIHLDKWKDVGDSFSVADELELKRQDRLRFVYRLKLRGETIGEQNNNAGKKTDQERIAEGECISSRGVEHCTNCIDRCEAFHHGIAVKELTAVVEPVGKEEPEQDKWRFVAIQSEEELKEYKVDKVTIVNGKSEFHLGWRMCLDWVLKNYRLARNTEGKVIAESAPPSIEDQEELWNDVRDIVNNGTEEEYVDSKTIDWLSRQFAITRNPKQP